MEIFKTYNSRLTPTCVKETLERARGNLAKNFQDKKNNQLSEKNYSNNVSGRISDNQADNSGVPPQNNDNMPIQPVDTPILDEFVFSSKEPYLELRNVAPSVADVKRLKSLATGRDGELTMILTYLYQHYILENEYPLISKTLEEIALVEMEHYERLSGAIVDFGGNPNLTDGQGNIWTGRNISTVKNVKKVLENNLKGERNAVKEYTHAARETNNRSLSDLYLRMAGDEELHAIVFEKLLETLT